MRDSVLFVAEQSSAAALDRARSLVSPHLASLRIITRAQLPAHASATAGNHNSCDAVVLFGFAPAFEELAATLAVLKPGARVSVEDVTDKQTVTQLMTLTGYVNIDAESENSPNVFAAKPMWAVGESAALQTIKPASKPAAKAGGAWKLSGLVEDDLIDEDDLLDDGIPDNAIQGCGTSGDKKKRACKNCSCGLAEDEAKEAEAVVKKMTEEQLQKKVTGCGNCSKGDAFRCGTCPFNGMPAFEAGKEQVMLKLTSDL